MAFVVVVLYLNGILKETLDIYTLMLKQPDLFRAAGIFPLFTDIMKSSHMIHECHANLPKSLSTRPCVVCFYQYDIFSNPS